MNAKGERQQSVSENTPKRVVLSENTPKESHSRIDCSSPPSGSFLSERIQHVLFKFTGLELRSAGKGSALSELANRRRGQMLYSVWWETGSALVEFV